MGVRMEVIAGPFGRRIRRRSGGGVLQVPARKVQRRPGAGISPFAYEPASEWRRTSSTPSARRERVRNGSGAPGRVSDLMGSLIKKRRKRMRKKKHKKLLKKTRWQRRQQGK